MTTVQAPPPERLMIGMTDVALLAKVRRPAVSMWRTRAARTDDPFPQPLESVRGRDTFDAVEVARWLVRTRRGNNPAALEDVAAFAATAGASPRQDRTAFAAVSALLCLKTLATEPLAALGRTGLLELADEADPNDEFLYAELDAAGDRLADLARYSDLLADAAFSPRAAFERLMADRWRSDLAEHASTTIAAPALALAARVAVDLTDRDGAPATYVDPMPGSSDLLLAVLAEHGDRGAVEVITAQGDDPNARLVRRRLRVHDVYRAGLRVEKDGTFTVDRAVTQVAQFPTPSSPVMGAASILAAIENIALQMDDGQRGVVLAPASALCDEIVDRTAGGIRAGLIRAGHVHAIVRLPRGLVPTRPRQALGMWVLGAADRSTSAEDRFSTVADLANEALTADVADDLVTDLAVATAGHTLPRARAFRFARAVPTRALLTARSSLVEVGTVGRGPRAGDPARVMVRLERALAAVDEPAAPAAPRLPAVRLAGIAAFPPATVGELVGSKTLRAISGNRLDEADLGPGHGIQIIGVAEVTGDAPFGSRVIDPLQLASRYGTAGLTEPGDVVFCTSPRPAAVVDREGSAVVAYPARVLRIDQADPGGLVPDLLAADINSVPDHAREWRVWALRRVSDVQRVPLSAALAEIRRVRNAAQDQLVRLDLLADLITDGVASGAIALHVDSPATGGS